MKNWFFFIAIFALTTACSSTRDAANNLVNGQPALHAIQNQELRVLMDRMNGLMMERFMTEQEMDIERERFARQIVETAKTLTSTASALMDISPSLGLDSEARNAFNALAKKLSEQAGSLEKHAENRRYNAISATLHEMSSTCMACHTLFRKI